MMMMIRAGVICALLSLASSTKYFEETFAKGWNEKWVISDWKKSEGTNGKWGWSHGKFYGDKIEDKGLSTTQDARYYAASAKMTDEPFDNVDKDLVIQYSVKFPYMMDCGGGYLKLARSGIDQKTFSGDTEYAIMFGPDICGSNTKKTHIIFNYNGSNLEKKEEVPCDNDIYTHWYTLVLRPDNTYSFKLDNVEKASGSLEEGWDFLPPKEIPDPKAKKPSDWVDEEMIDDPTQIKPANWDDEPKMIRDAEATKPDDWDDDADGDWDAPMIDNPKYKGEWTSKQIKNPKYKGKWEAPIIDNPDYLPNPKLYIQKDLQFVGFELWQMLSGSIFDNILVTDDEAEASEIVDAWMKKNKVEERKMHAEQEAAERKARQAESGEPEVPEEPEDEIDLEADDDDEDDEKTEL